MKDAKVYSIIVSYNGAKWLQKCLNSLATSSIHTEIIVVDNNSSDTTIALIEKEFSNVLLLKQQENLGFGKANNIGISYALQQGAESIFLLNQDACVKKDSIEKLIAVSKDNLDYGIISPMQFNWDGTALEYYFEQFAIINKEFSSDISLKKELKSSYDLPFVNAAAWLLPRKTIEIIGGFDPIFYHYGEDNNYCQRVLYHGLKIGFVPSASIFHDSKIRKGIKIELFSEEYFRNEQKQLQIKYANINRSFNSKDKKEININILKLIVVNLFKLNFKNVKGYLKKYKIFGKEFEKITQSRKINQTIGNHYFSTNNQQLTTNN